MDVIQQIAQELAVKPQQVNAASLLDGKQLHNLEEHLNYNRFPKSILGAKAVSKNSAPLIFSFFSGAGFLDLGFEKAGFEIGYVNEVHKPFLDAYKHSRQKMNVNPPRYGYFEGDIECCLSGNEGKNLSDFVALAKKENQLIGFVGGPPCPDFSIGGKNRGQHGDNGKLSQTYVDIICTQKPDFFVFENVKGLYRTIRHRQFFDGLKDQLNQAGYSCTERLINAIEYGVLQDHQCLAAYQNRLSAQ